MAFPTSQTLPAVSDVQNPHTCGETLEFLCRLADNGYEVQFNGNCDKDITMQNSAVKQRRGCLFVAGRVILALLAVLAVLIIAGMAYESTARARDLASVTPPGRLIDVGGHSLHLVCTGEAHPGQPTILLEAGAGGWSIHWYNFQQQVAEFARVCAYDRAGFGWSEPGPFPRDGAQIVAELHALLAAAGEEEPFMLVGASRGGQYARLYAATYPAEVVALVLVDGEPEDFRARSTLAQQAASQNRVVFPVLAAVSRVGIFRLMGGDPASAPEVPCIPFLVKRLPADQHAAYVAVEGQPACFAALLGEERASDAREEQVRAQRDLGDLPLFVLTHGIAGSAVGGGSPEAVAEAEMVWQELQAEQAGLSTQSLLIQATGSGHNIADDEPELVLDTIRGLLYGLLSSQLYGQE